MMRSIACIKCECRVSWALVLDLSYGRFPNLKRRNDIKVHMCDVYYGCKERSDIC